MVRAGKLVVMTFHDEMTLQKWEASSPLSRFAARKLMRSRRVSWVAVSEPVKVQLESLNTPAGRISVIPAFIRSGDHVAGISDLPRAVNTFLASHSPIVSTYGSKLILDLLGNDVYGFDLCLEMTHDLKRHFPQIGILILLPDIRLIEYFAELQQRVVGLGIKDNVCFLTGPTENAGSIWCRSNVFVRATNTDGDAISVREALSLHVPVVASDASPRPEGVVLFRSRDQADLTESVRRVLAGQDTTLSRLSDIEVNDNFEALCELYRHIRVL
jgi:glycosyltransferase involved in cell wall biosynthesis